MELIDLLTVALVGDGVGHATALSEERTLLTAFCMNQRGIGQNHDTKCRRYGDMSALTELFKSMFYIILTKTLRGCRFWISDIRSLLARPFQI